MDIKKLMDKKFIFVGIAILFVAFLACLPIVIAGQKDKVQNIDEEEVVEKVKEEKSSFFVDIKGCVKKPGVYSMEDGSIVNDVIKKAGGLKSNAYTKNINLAQSLKSEMVIYIFSKSEINKLTEKKIITDAICKCETIEVNNCIKSEKEETTEAISNSSNEETTSKLININTASKEELMSIPGIGEAKAISIIEYRKENKFSLIEDIKNVSGIGDSLFAKIKDYITV